MNITTLFSSLDCLYEGVTFYNFYEKRYSYAGGICGQTFYDDVPLNWPQSVSFISSGQHALVCINFYKEYTDIQLELMLSTYGTLS